MNDQPYVIERVFDATAEDVWSAITEEQLMKQWYFDLPGFKPEVGFKFQFKGGPSPERQYLHLCEILEVIPQKKLKHSWRYEGYEGNSFVTFELFAEGAKTKLRLTHEGLETLPGNNPDFAKENFAKGWTQIITVSLKNFLGK